MGSISVEEESGGGPGQDEKGGGGERRMVVVEAVDGERHEFQTGDTIRYDMYGRTGILRSILRIYRAYIVRSIF